MTLRKIFICIFGFLACFILLIHCGQQPRDLEADEVLLEKAKKYFSIIPKPTGSELYPTEQIKVELGRQLFKDSLLSFRIKTSCNTCHILEKYGVDSRRVSVGDNGHLGSRNTPTVFNAHLQFAQFWDARDSTVESQVKHPIFGDNEMGMPSDTLLIKRLMAHSKYPELFRMAFPDQDSSITLKTISASIGAFERTLVTNDRFDSFLQGDLDALDDREKKGLRLFIDRGCIPCHSGPLLGGMMVQPFSVYGYYWDYTGSEHLDKGLYAHTYKEEDKFKFKVSPLRNVAMTGPYFHDGSVTDLKEAIRIMAAAELNTLLNNQEISDIEAFLKSLTGTIEIE